MKNLPIDAESPKYPKKSRPFLLLITLQRPWTESEAAICRFFNHKEPDFTPARELARMIFRVSSRAIKSTFSEKDIKPKDNSEENADETTDEDIWEEMEEEKDSGTDGEQAWEPDTGEESEEEEDRKIPRPQHKTPRGTLRTIESSTWTRSEFIMLGMAIAPLPDSKSVVACFPHCTPKAVRARKVAVVPWSSAFPVPGAAERGDMAYLIKCLDEMSAIGRCLLGSSWERILERGRDPPREVDDVELAKPEVDDETSLADIPASASIAAEEEGSDRCNRRLFGLWNSCELLKVD